MVDSFIQYFLNKAQDTCLDISYDLRRRWKVPSVDLPIPDTEPLHFGVKKHELKMKVSMLFMCQY